MRCRSRNDRQGGYALCKVVQIVYDAPMTTIQNPPNVRLTITVSAHVHQVFQRFAKAASMPTGRAMGEWLGDTVEAAEFTAVKMEQARAAPKLVARELHAYAQGLADETGEFMSKITAKGVSDRAAQGMRQRPQSGAGTQSPPSSNTGGYRNVSTTSPKGSKS